MMKDLSRYDLWYGRDVPPGEIRVLRAGPVSAVLDGGDLRYIRCGNVELVRRIYMAVRDLNWNTLPVEVTNLRVIEQGDTFSVGFDRRDRAGPIDFSWHGEISGSADGTIRYVMDGLAGADFSYAKIGLCIHHPIAENAGRPFSGHTPTGPVSGVLPQTIGPQVHLPDGTDLPLFTPVDALQIDLGDGAAVNVAFEGDLFEMEDQRNWTDASFKTASTPASLGYVHHARAGQQRRQSVTVWPSGIQPVPNLQAAQGARQGAAQERRITIGSRVSWPRPLVGLAMASHGQNLSAREIALLQRLHLAHLRVDLRLADPTYRTELERAIAACRILGCGLEVALFLPSDASMTETVLGDLSLLLADSGVNVPRVLVFRDGDEVAAGRWVTLARDFLRGVLPDAAFVGGTNVYFNELNRNRPEITAMDAVTYSINPQIHAFDEASLTEALEGQSETVDSARAFCGPRPIVVSPVTFKPRFNAVASVPEGEIAADQLPSQVDPRQMSLFGAAWTLGSLKRLAESGASSITYYETTGWRGVMETAAGSPPAAPFPSRHGMVFPLYHVFADFAEWPTGHLRAAVSSDPLSVNALVVDDGGKLHLLLANMTAQRQQVAVGPLLAGPATGPATVRRLNDETAPLACFDPAAWRAAAATTLPIAGDGWLRLQLAPFEIVRVDSPPVDNPP